MKQYIFVSILIVLAFGGCGSSNEQSIIFYDERLELDVLQSLDAAAIPYKKDNSTIWYSIKHDSEVERIYQAAVNSRPVKYTFYDENEGKEFVDLLKEMRILPEVSVGDGGVYTVYVDKKKSVEAKKAFDAILVSSGSE